MPHRPRGTRPLRPTFMFVAVVGYLLTVGHSSRLAGSEFRNSPLVKALEQVRPAVVNIEGKKVLPVTAASLPSEESRNVHGMGTGIVIDERGYILTNHHVVDGVRRIRVTLLDNESHLARVVAEDPASDIAIIKIDHAEPLPVITIGTATDLMHGEPVVAVGNAYGYQHTITRGVVSALHRQVRVSDTQEYRDLIQTDASINPGNSGGPLLNADGELVGINVAVRAGAHGIGFAIPVDLALSVAGRILTIEKIDGHWHGIVPTEPNDGRPHGVRVKSVKPGSPAAACGISAGDVVTQVDGRPVAWMVDIERAMLDKPVGSEIRVATLRDGEERTASLRLASLTGGQTVEVDPIWQVVGADVEAVAGEDFAQDRTSYRGGLVVRSVRAGGPASTSGIREGDVLVGMHVWEMISRENVEYVLQLKELPRISPIKFYLVRNGKPLHGYLDLKLADAGDSTKGTNRR
jgi:serine protease Do